MPLEYVLTGTVDEVADFGEGLDFREAPVHVLSGEAEDGAIEIDVVSAGKFGIEAGAEFQQGGDPAVSRPRFLRWVRECRRRFAAACSCRFRFPPRCRRSRRDAPVKLMSRKAQ